MTRNFDRKVGDRTITITLDTDELKVGSDLLAEGGRVAGLIGLVGELSADRTYQSQVLDAEYRHWRAKKGEAITGSTDKISEWKVKDAIEADARFLDFKQRIALVDSEIEFLRVYLDGLRVKAQMIRASVDLIRATTEGEQGGPDLGRTPAPRRAKVDSEGDRDSRVAAGLKRPVARKED